MSDVPQIFEMSPNNRLPASVREFWELLKADRGDAVKCYRLGDYPDAEWIYRDPDTNQVYWGVAWYRSTGKIDSDVDHLYRGPMLDVAEQKDY